MPQSCGGGEEQQIIHQESTAKVNNLKNGGNEMKGLRKLLTKKLIPLFMAVAMVIGMVFPAMAAEGAYSQDVYFYYYMNDVLTATPFGHNAIESYDIVKNSDGTCEVTLYTQETSVYGIIGYITDFAAGDAEVSDLVAGDVVVFTGTFDANGFIDVSTVWSYTGFPMDLTSGLYLYIAEAAE